MNKKLLLLIVVILIALVVGLILVTLRIDSGKSPTASSSDSSNPTTNSLLTGGYVLPSDDKSTAIAVGKLDRVFEENGAVFGYLDFGNSSRKEKILLFGNGITEFILQESKTLETIPERKDYDLKRFKNNQDLIKELNKSKGENITLSLLLDSKQFSQVPGFNEGLLSCNRALVDALGAKKDLPDCTSAVNNIVSYVK